MLFRPTLDEIKAAIVCGKGGLCYSMNIFMKFLLEALGYDVCHISSDIFHPKNHVLTIVNNLKKTGDQYIVEAGCGYPCFTPISLDFKGESTIYSQSFLHFKFAHEEGKIVRYHKRSRTLMDIPPSTSGGEEEYWRKYCVMDPTPQDFSFFNDPMDEVYGNPDTPLIIFHKIFRIVGYVKDNGNLRFVAFKNTSLLLENDSHQLKETKFRTVEELLDQVQLYFPHLYSDAAKAVQNLELAF